MEILAVENLSFTYPGETEPALREVSLCLEAGDFAILTGATGCGKSTLMRLIKPELAPRGERRGSIRFCGRETDGMTARETAAKIGYVFQRPEEQIVTDRVWHELAFGMENLGIPESVLRRRVAEAAQFFGLEDCFDMSPDRLSGGKKQLLNLAAATALEPELLLMDEPTARLDPIAAKSFLAAAERLNRETGMTILMAEHRLEDSLSRANRLILMDGGRITDSGEPRAVCGRIPAGASAEGALPAAARIWRACGMQGSCPLNTGEGRSWAEERLRAEGRDLPGALREPPAEKRSGAGKRAEREKEKPEEAALEMREVRFRFERNGREILRSLNLQVRRGEIFALLGGNGSGKTTLLRAAAGLISPYSGDIRLFGRRIREYREGELRRSCVSLLPQDVQTLFLRGSVREELKDSGIDPAEAPFGLSRMADRHPYDLSGGEQQLLGLAKVLASRPRLLLLDEPTGGLDAEWRRRIREILRKLRAEGMTLVAVTHDAEFAAETADRCGLLFRGRIEAAEEPGTFFAGGSYYVTPASRILPGCVTAEEAAERIGKERGA